jgi:hypothetical protein
MRRVQRGQRERPLRADVLVVRLGEVVDGDAVPWVDSVVPPTVLGVDDGELIAQTRVVKLGVTVEWKLADRAAETSWARL